MVDGETGILVPLKQHKEAPFEPIDPDMFSKDLANAINHIIDNKSLKEHMAKNGRKRVEVSFDWAAIAKQVEELYKSLKK